MKCKVEGCNDQAPPKRIYCKHCQSTCNSIALQKMINGEPLPEGNTLKENLIAFMADSLKAADISE